MKKFEELGLSDVTLKAITKKGFEEPTEIQAKTIPLLLRNDLDIIAQAQTGTGKTAAFALPLLDLIDTTRKDTSSIILAPTRELVIQICEEMNSLRGENNLKIVPVYGGQSITLQLKRLKKGADIIVGTPGRIMDHLGRGTIKLNTVDFFILDEADEMLNMGFIEDIEEILSHTKPDKRVLLFSATMPARIKKLAESYMGNYKHIKAHSKLTKNLTDQIYFEVAVRDKFEALCRIIDIEEKFYGMIFCRTKSDVDEISQKLIERGYSAEGIHGDIAQAQREKILNKFRRKRTTILVATDVAARGIDVDNLTHVINFSIPQNPEAYVHRIGRTGRAGRSGTAITFITHSEFRKLGFIKKITKSNIEKRKIPAVIDIIKAKKSKFESDLNKIIEYDNLGQFLDFAEELTFGKNPEEVLAATLKYFMSDVFDESKYSEIREFNNRENDKNRLIKGGSTRLFIAKGRKNGFTNEDIIRFVTKKAKISPSLIDNLSVHDEYSFITVSFKEAEIILNKFRNIKSGSRSVVVKAKARK